jgi:5-methylcytosine-specific restriction protein A
MSISHYATDALTITGQRDMKSNETIRNNTKTNAIYAGEQDGFIRYGAGKEINVDAMLTKLCAKCGRVMSLGSALCPTCQAKSESRHKQYDNNVRDKRIAKFYASPEWIRTRNLVLIKAGYQCESCRLQGKLTPATEVHHKIPVKVDWSKRLTLDNLIALCHRCHMNIEARGR